MEDHRELRNAINHEYEDDEPQIARLFEELTKAAPTLSAYLGDLTRFCKNAYGIEVDAA